MLNFEELDDEALLTLYNALPRNLEANTALLVDVENEIKLREMLIEHSIPLEERTDDWLAERRDAIKREVALVKKQDDILKEERELIDAEFVRRFEERGTSGTKAARFTISIKEDDHYPETYDRTDFENYVLETKKIHLLQKRLSLSAVQEELAAMREEYEAYSKRLNKSIDKEATAEEIYRELNIIQDESVLENKLSILKATKQLVSTLEQELLDYYSIPGIRVVTKRTINSVKRG